MKSWGFIGAAYTSQSLAADGERCVNLYPEMIESGRGKSPAVLYSVPGKRLFATLPTAPVRAMLAGDHRLFVVAGSVFYEVFQDGTSNRIGDVGNDGSPAQIIPNFRPDNANQIMVVSAGKAYIATGVSLEQPIAAVYGAFLDGYFIAQQPDSNKFQISGLYDGLNWDALDFDFKAGAADRLIAVWADHEELWLIGQRTIEVWYNSGAANFPFTRIQGAFIEQGCSAPWSLAKLDNSLFWLGGDDRGAGVVWRANGFTPVRVSNHAVETAIQQYAAAGTIADAVAYAYQENGHAFYVLHFPTADKTWVYDATTSAGMGQAAWHERAQWVNGRYAADRGRYHAYVQLGNATAGKHYVGDGNSGNIYIQSLDIYDDAGTPLRRLRSCPHLSDEMKWTFYRSLQVDMQVGTGLIPIPNARLDLQRAPSVMLRCSDDGGFTWGEELTETAGAIGEYRHRVKWRRLGRSRDRVFEVAISDSIPVCLVDAYVEALPGGRI